MKLQPFPCFNKPSYLKSTKSILQLYPTERVKNQRELEQSQTETEQ